MQETQVWFLGWEDPLEKGKATHSSILAWRIPRTIDHGVSKSWIRLSYFHFTLLHLCRTSSQKFNCLFYPFNSKFSFHLQILKSLREISKVYCISQVTTSASQWLRIIKVYFLNKPYMFMEGWSWSSSQKPGYWNSHCSSSPAAHGKGQRQHSTACPSFHSLFSGSRRKQVPWLYLSSKWGSEISPGKRENWIFVNSWAFINIHHLEKTMHYLGLS